MFVRINGIPACVNKELLVYGMNGDLEVTLAQMMTPLSLRYRSGTVNSKSFVGKVFLRIKRKFELTYAL